MEREKLLLAHSQLLTFVCVKHIIVGKRLICIFESEILTKVLPTCFCPFYWSSSNLVYSHTLTYLFVLRLITLQLLTQDSNAQLQCILKEVASPSRFDVANLPRIVPSRRPPVTSDEIHTYLTNNY